MYAFPDVPRDEVRRISRCSRVFGAVMRSAQGQVYNESDRIQEAPTNVSGAFYAPRGRENPKELVPHPQPAKFFALGAQFDVIQGICNQDLRFKTFYDLTGSGGKAGLAAVFFHNWSSVVSLESCRQKFDVAVMARRIVKRVEPPGMLTSTTAWRIQHATFKSADWIDGDVVLFDGTVFERLDEGVLCRYLQGRLRALQAGSFVILFTICSDQLLIGDAFQLVYRQTVKHTGEGVCGNCFTSWLFKTTMHSNDYRVGVFEAPSTDVSSSNIS